MLCRLPRRASLARSGAVGECNHSRTRRLRYLHRQRSELVVEDDSDIADLVCLGLRREGFDVDVCSHGAAVLRAAEHTRPDVVVLDWMLPGIDGLEVCKRLRALGGPGTRMLATRGSLNDCVAGLDTCADEYAVTPSVSRSAQSPSPGARQRQRCFPRPRRRAAAASE